MEEVAERRRRRQERAEAERLLLEEERRVRQARNAEARARRQQRQIPVQSFSAASDQRGTVQTTSVRPHFSEESLRKLATDDDSHRRASAKREFEKRLAAEKGHSDMGAETKTSGATREEKFANVVSRLSLQRQLSDQGRSLFMSVLTTPPSSFNCPVTMELMEDPVVCADGHTYERSAIEAWLHVHGSNSTSPVTGLPLAHTHLVPNFALRSSIDDFIKVRDALVAPPPPVQVPAGEPLPIQPPKPPVVESSIPTVQPASSNGSSAVDTTPAEAPSSSPEASVVHTNPSGPEPQEDPHPPQAVQDAPRLSRNPSSEYRPVISSWNSHEPPARQSPLLRHESSGIRSGRHTYDYDLPAVPLGD